MNTRSGTSSWRASAGLALLLCLGAVPPANASYNATVTPGLTQYIAGTANTFLFTVQIAGDGSIEFVDNVGFAFPPGVTVTSATGPSPYTACGGGAGNYSNPTPETALWSTPGHPSGCGAFDAGSYNFSVTVAVPPGFSGPLEVLATTYGDGWPPPLTDPQISTFTFVFLAATAIGVPTLSATGLAALALLLLGAGCFVVRRRRRP